MSDDISASSVLGASEQTYDRPISERVIRAVADREGREQAALHPPLYDAISPEALDSLFEPAAAEGRLEFHWLGYRIVVFSSGSIRVIDDEETLLGE